MYKCVERREACPFKVFLVGGFSFFLLLTRQHCSTERREGEVGRTDGETAERKTEDAPPPLPLVHKLCTPHLQSCQVCALVFRSYTHVQKQTGHPKVFRLLEPRTTADALLLRQQPLIKRCFEPCMRACVCARGAQSQFRF